MSNFKCDKCGFTNIDCGKEGYKTPKEIKMEKAIISALNFLACPDVIDEDTCNEQLAFDELRQVLKEIGEEE